MKIHTKPPKRAVSHFETAEKLRASCCRRKIGVRLWLRLWWRRRAIDAKVNPYWFDDDLLLHLFGDSYVVVLNVVIGRSLSLDVVVCPMFLHGNSWMCDSPEKTCWEPACPLEAFAGPNCFSRNTGVGRLLLTVNAHSGTSLAGWWFGTCFMTFHSVGNGIIIPTDFHSIIFQRDWNHFFPTNQRVFFGGSYHTFCRSPYQPGSQVVKVTPIFLPLQWPSYGHHDESVAGLRGIFWICGGRWYTMKFHRHLRDIPQI